MAASVFLSTRFTQETAARLWSEHANRALLSLEDPRFLALARHFLMGRPLSCEPQQVLGNGWNALKPSDIQARFVLLGRTSQELRFVFSFDEQRAVLTAAGQVTEELSLDPERLEALD
ncbi:MAG: hypothetical protein AMXMBFR33_11090 [Candidatus Xenobia bacterium]|jgi:hypothetical protein